MVTKKRTLTDVVKSVMAAGIGSGGATNGGVGMIDDAPELRTEESFSIGDEIALFNENIYWIIADGIIDLTVYMTESDPGNVPKQFRDCIFKIENASNYAQQKRYNKRLIEAKEQNHLSNPEVIKELEALRARAETEKAQNESERRRCEGSDLIYGQPIQLVHKKSKKYLTVARESSDLQKNCLKLVLDSEVNAFSWWYVLPAYKRRSEGERVRVTDQVLLYNRKLHQFIHQSHERYPNGRLEINASTVSSRLSFHQFAKAGSESGLYVHAGDVICLLHKEADGYLTVPNPEKNEICIHVQKETKRTHSINSMWEIEMHNPSKGGVANFNRAYHLRHVASGKYLAAAQKRADEENEDGPIVNGNNNYGSSRNLYDETSNNNNNNNSGGGITGMGGSSNNLLGPSTGSGGSLLATLQRHRSANNSSWSAMRDALGILGNQILDVPQNDKYLVCDLYLTEEPGPETLFALHPSNKRDGPIQYDSFIRMRHNLSNTWVHALPGTIDAAKIQRLARGNSSSNVLKNLRKKTHDQIISLTNESYRKMNTHPTVFEEDIFSCSLVPASEVEDFYFISTIAPTLQSFLHKVTNDEAISSTDARDAANALTHLIIFCTTDTDILDPLKREGTPVESRQHMLRETKILDYVLDLLCLPFEHGYINLSVLEKPEYEVFHQLFCLAYRLLKQAVKSNKANGLYLSPYIKFFQSQMGYRLKAEDTLMELVRENYALLNQITYDQIFFFIDIIYRTGKQPRYLAFLSALCQCEGKALVNNQELIVEILLEDQKYRDELLMLLSIEEDNDIHIRFQTNGAQTKMPLSAFISDFKDDEILEYFAGSINLLSKLCEGRNKRAIEKISKLCNRQVLLRLITDEGLNPSFRACFGNLLLHGFIDVDPYQKNPLISYTRKWEESKEEKQDHILDEHRPFLAELKKFLNDYFRVQCSNGQDSAEVELNNLTLVLVTMCRTMIELHLYTELKEVKSLVHSLFKVVDGRGDTSSDRSDDARFLMTFNNVVIHKCKLEALKALNLITDYRVNRRLSVFIAYYKHKKENNELVDLDVDYALNQPIDKEEQQVIKNMFKDFSLDLNASTHIDDVLLDLMLYKNKDLATSALHLLFRNYNEKEEVAEALSNVEILVSREMIILTQDSKRLLAQIASAVHPQMKEQAEQDTIGSLTLMLRYFDRNKLQSQRVLRSLGAHKVIMNVLETLPWSTSENRKQILLRCYTVLSRFVHQNPANQALLFEYLEFFIGDLRNNLSLTVVASLLQDIVRDNHTLCSNIEEKHVRNIVNLIAERGKYPIFLNFLKTIVFVGGQPNKSNQTMVVKILMEREKDVLVLFKDPEGAKKKEHLMKINDHLNNPEQSLLAYHVTLIELLALCSFGKNHVTEIKLQSLMSIEYIVSQVCAKGCIKQLRNALLRFIDEVYLNVRTNPKDLEENEFLWVLIKKLNNDLAAISTSKVIDKHYVFGILMPLFGNLFANIRVASNREDQRAVINEIFDNIMRLFHLTANPDERRKIYEVMKIVGEHNELVKSRPDIISFLITVRVNTRPQRGNMEQMRRMGMSVSKIEEKDLQMFEAYTKLIRVRILQLSDALNLVEKFKSQDRKYTRQLVKILRKLSQQYSNGDYKPDDLQITIKATTVLRHMVELIPEEQTEERIVMQNRLNACQVPKMILDLICTGSNQVVYHALLLAIALLNGGNVLVQRKMYKSLTTRHSEAFFNKIKERIRQSINEIKEKRYFIKRKGDALEAARSKKLNKQSSAAMVEDEGDENGGAAQQQAKKDKPAMNRLVTHEEASMEQEFEETGFISEILRFLQLLCEGHYLDGQNLLREQPFNYTSVNLIQECLEYLVNMQRYIDRSNVHIAIQLFKTLTEFVQGPCLENAREMALRSKLFFVCNELLLDNFTDKLEYADVLELKNQILITLLSVVEGANDVRIAQAMMKTLHLKKLKAQMIEIDRKLSTKGKHFFTKDEKLRQLALGLTRRDIKQKKLVLLEELENLGMRYHFLFCTLNDMTNNKLEEHDKVVMDDGGPEGSITAASQRFQQQTGRVEIVRDGRLERVYFHIPEDSKYLSKKIKKKFIKTVNRRDGANGKIDGLMDKFDFFVRSIEHEKKLAKRGLSFLHKLFMRIKTFSFILSIIMNLVIIFSYKKTFNAVKEIPFPGQEVHFDFAKIDGEFRWSFLDIGVVILGLIQLLLAAAIAVIYLIESAPLTILAHWQPRLPLDVSFDAVPRNLSFLFKCLQYLILYDSYFKFLCVFCVISLLGFFTDQPLFYSFLLLEIMVRSRTLNNVRLVVTRNMSFLGLTMLMLAFILYIFSAILFSAYYDAFVIPIEWRQFNYKYVICKDMLACFQGIVAYGFHSEGWFEDIGIPPDPRWHRIIFDVTFFIIVGVLLSDMVFGTIVDSFGDFREEQNWIEEDITNRCFICHFESSVFNRKANEGISFKDHIANDHNVWNYVYFLLYLLQKDRTEYSGTEQYVADKFSKGDYSFFPTHRSMVLEESEKKKAMSKIDEGDIEAAAQVVLAELQKSGMELTQLASLLKDTVARDNSGSGSGSGSGGGSGAGGGGGGSNNTDGGDGGGTIIGGAGTGSGDSSDSTQP